MTTQKEINNLHDACQAYREGLKWAGLDCGGLTYAHTSKNDSKLYSKEDRAGENFWELYRQISFMVMGAEPFAMTSKIDNTVPEDKFEDVTAEDMLTIAACIKRASKI